MLKGIDISHWNSLQKVETVLNESRDFCIIKASEGRTGRDSALGKNILWGKDLFDVFGLYHYCRPENNKVESEWKNFRNAIEYAKNYLNRPYMIVLDIEGKALMPAYREWMSDYAKLIKKDTGKSPMIYMQASAINKYYTNNLDILNCGLWVAHYDNNTDCANTRAKYGIGQLVAMKQYTSKPIDYDVFYGTKEQFERYCV